MMMQRPGKWLPRLPRGSYDQSGAAAIEYAILAAFVAAVIVAVVLVIGQQTQSLFSCTSDTMKGGTNSCN